jgi:predicted SnoaL-like aldol condensation-catalyzing enzyme
MSAQTDRNKQAALAFYDLMFNQCRPAEAVERYVGDRYVQHNPDAPDGVDRHRDRIDGRRHITRT